MKLIPITSLTWINTYFLQIKSHTMGLDREVIDPLCRKACAIINDWTDMATVFSCSGHPTPDVPDQGYIAIVVRRTDALMRLITATCRLESEWFGKPEGSWEPPKFDIGALECHDHSVMPRDETYVAFSIRTPFFENDEECSAWWSIFDRQLLEQL